MRTPVAATCSTGVGRELDDREGEDAGAGAPRERRARARPARTSASAAERGERRQHERAADEAHDRLAAAAAGANTGKAWPTIAAGHRRPARPTSRPAPARRGRPRRALGAVAREGRPGAPRRRAARARSRRPGCRRRCGAGRRRGGARRAARPGPSRAGSRSDRDDVLHAVPIASFHLVSLPARGRARGALSRMGLDRPELRRDAGPALLAAARHGPRDDDDAVGRPAALGDVRRLGGRRRARRVPRALAGRARWRDAGAGAVRRAAGAGPLRTAHGAEATRWRAPPQARRAGRAGGDPHARGDPARAARRPSTAPSRVRRASCATRPGLLAAVGDRRVAASLRQATFSLWRGLDDATRVRLRGARPPRGRAPHARRALVRRGAVRPLRAVRREGTWDGRDPLRAALTPARSRAPRSAPPSATSGSPPPGCTVPPASHRPSHAAAPAGPSGAAPRAGRAGRRRRSRRRAAPVSRSRSAGRARRTSSTSRSRTPSRSTMRSPRQRPSRRRRRPRAR